MIRLLLLSLLLVATASPASAQLTLCSTSWTNPAGGAWTDGGNWDNGVPGASDDACITLDGTYTVTVGAFDVNTLTLGDATNTGTQTLVKTTGLFSVVDPSTIEPSGEMEWTNGYLTGGTLINTGLVRLDGSGTSRGVNSATGATFRNEGTLEHVDAGIFYIFGNDARVENAGLWDLQNDGDFRGFSGAMSVFVNEASGTLQKSGGVGLSNIVNGPLVIENEGTIDVQSGELRFSRPVTHTGATLTASAGALLNMTNPLVFSGTISGSPAGDVRIATSIDASAGSTWNLAGTGMLWQNGYLTDGTLTNTGLVRIDDSGGSRGVSSGTGAMFRNEGTLEHVDAGIFYIFGDNARVENAGLWDLQDDGSFRGFSGAMSVFVNEASGTLQKSGGVGLSNIVNGPLVIENEGTIDVQSGELRFDRPSTHTGATLTTSAGAVLRFSSFGVTFVGTLSGTQAGTLQLDDATTAGAGATWAFDGTGLLWQNGYLGTGTLTNTGLVRLDGSGGARGVSSGTGATFRNEGTLEHVDAGIFYIFGNDARVENAGLWDLQNDGDFRGFSGAMSVFVNEASGTLQKSGGVGLSNIVNGPLVIENEGTIDVQSGELRFGRPSTHTDATLTTSAGAVLRFSTSGVTFVGTVSGTQAGTLQLDDATTAGAGATWAFGGTGLLWQDGYLGTGTLTNTGLVRLDGSGATRGVNSGTGATFRNEGTLEHVDPGFFYLFGDDARVENAGLWDLQNDGDLRGSSGAMSVFVNETTGVFQKSGGAGITLFTSGPLVFENAGTVSVLSGEIDVNRPFDHQAGGVIGGTGIFDITGSTPFTFNGDVSPGTSPGILTWQTTFGPSPGSTLQVEIAGANGPGDPDGHDQLAVVGAATLGGILEIDVTSTVGLTVGDMFTILTAPGGVTGTFSSIELDGLPGPSFSITYNANDVVLTLDALSSPLTLRGQPGWRTLATPFPDLPLGGRQYGMLETIYTSGYLRAQRDQRNMRGTANVFLYDESTGIFAPPFDDGPIGGGVGFWVYVFNDDDSFTPGTQGGFPKPLQSAGTPATFPFDIPVTYTPSVVRDPETTPALGFNLVGNPANEDIDWDQLTRTNVSNVLYIYDRKVNDGDGGWRTWNGTTGTLPTEGLIPVGQGFHVETTGADPELIVPPAALLGTQSSFYRLTSGEEELPSSAGKTEAAPLVRFQLDAVIGEAERSAEAFVSFEPEAAIGFDSRDARLLASSPGATAARLYVRLPEAHGEEAGSALQIAATPVPEGAMQIDLGAEALFEGVAAGAEAELSWEAVGLPEAWSATLTDRQSGASYDLTEAGSARLAISAAEAKTVTAADADPTHAATLSAIEAATALGEPPPTPTSPQARSLKAIAPVSSLTGSASAATRFVIEIDPLGALVGETGPGLSAVYPNPAARVARVELRLLEEADVRVGVYDVLGRRVTDVYDGVLTAGIHTVEVPVGALAPGAYIVRVDGPGLGESRRLTVAR